jgi:hypothetical protein
VNKEKVSKVLEMIAQDMKDDAKNFDGEPFTGRTVAEYFGNQGAATTALANIVKDLVNEQAAQQGVQPTCRHCGAINAFEFDNERQGNICVRCGERG